MRKGAWVGLGLIATLVITGAALLVPTGGFGSPVSLVAAGSAGNDAQPVWNTGNLCTATFNNPHPGYDQCVSQISYSRAPLWYNFSAGKVKNGVVNVTIYGSNDCIFLNFHSFDTTINLHVLGTGYSCAYASNGTISGGVPDASGFLGGVAEWGNGRGCQSSGYGGGIPEWNHGGGGGNVTCGPGINVAIVSENDVFNLVQGNATVMCHNHMQQDGNYATNVTVYATTIAVNVTQNQNNLNTTVTYIGSSSGFGTCPYKVETGRIIPWVETANGDKDTFNVILVNEAGAKHVPPNSPYGTEPLAPPNGTANGYYDVFGNETTTTAPVGTCQYIGV